MATNRDRGSVRSHLLARFPLMFICFHWFSYISKHPKICSDVSAYKCSLFAAFLQPPCNLIAISVPMGPESPVVPHGRGGPHRRVFPRGPYGLIAFYELSIDSPCCPYMSTHLHPPSSVAWNRLCNYSAP